jgi:hypothetical protein
VIKLVLSPALHVRERIQIHERSMDGVSGGSLAKSKSRPEAVKINQVTAGRQLLLVIFPEKTFHCLLVVF